MVYSQSQEFGNKFENLGFILMSCAFLLRIFDIWKKEKYTKLFDTQNFRVLSDTIAFVWSEWKWRQ